MLAARARRSARPRPCPLRAGPALRAQGIDVLTFTAGEPDFDTPERVKDAAIAALAGGRPSTPAPAGPELEAAIAPSSGATTSSAYEPGVIVSVGRSTRSTTSARSCSIPGDEVLVPSPLLGEPTRNRCACSTAPRWWCRPTEARGFQLDWPRFAPPSRPGPGCLILNSPDNPPGAVYPGPTWRRRRPSRVERGFWIVSDECYEALAYEGGCTWRSRHSGRR